VALQKLVEYRCKVCHRDGPSDIRLLELAFELIQRFPWEDFSCPIDCWLASARLLFHDGQDINLELAVQNLVLWLAAMGTLVAVAGENTRLALSAGRSPVILDLDLPKFVRLPSSLLLLLEQTSHFPISSPVLLLDLKKNLLIPLVKLAPSTLQCPIVLHCYPHGKWSYLRSSFKVAVR